ncbi:MAG: SMC-Scp complex subunit ScpB [bacterium]|nr:SMC-Scp complex subunit ScpB [bacterium]
MKRELEALLFAADSPLTIARLKKIFPERENAEIRTAITELEQDYTAAGLAFTVVEFGGGWQIATRPEYAPLVDNLLKSRSFTRLSKAGLEVLAIIAYRQPITRLEIDEIRGVNSSGAISTLTERNLITVVGRSQTVGNPLLYGTTREFLNHLGLKGLGQLPDLPALEGVLEDREQLKEFASRIGREVTDEELEEYFAAPVAHVQEPVAPEPDEARGGRAGRSTTATGRSGRRNGSALRRRR